MSQVAQALKAQDLAKVMTLARSLLPFWAEVPSRQHRQLIHSTLAVAAKLGDAYTATALLRPFAITEITAKTAPLVAELLGRYGPAWCVALLKDWTSERKANLLPDARMTWMNSALRAIWRALCNRSSSEGRILARQILSDQWAWIPGQLKQLDEILPANELAKEQTRFCEPILALLDCAQITKDLTLQKQILSFLTDRPTALQVSLGVLRAARKQHQPDTLRSLGLKPAHSRCSRDVSSRLTTPTRAKNDWSVSAAVSCPCALCSTLKQYLRDRKQVRLEWPLAQGQRAHIHNTIDAHDLPVRHATQRTGRPFTLVLEKTAAVFERDAAERLSLRKELAWLDETAGDF